MLAITICCIWAKKGGDESFEQKHPYLKHILHIIHHWMFGLALVSFSPLISLFFPLHSTCFVIGLGLGLFVDDVIFHNFENYFMRSKE
jgi:hypothetical protein